MANLDLIIIGAVGAVGVALLAGGAGAVRSPDMDTQLSAPILIIPGLLAIAASGAALIVATIWRVWHG